LISPPDKPEKPCEMERSEANAHGSLLGAFVVSCKEDGNYEAKQCHAGYCWCVDSFTGIEVRGSRRGPTEGDVTCGMFSTHFLNP